MRGRTSLAAVVIGFLAGAAGVLFWGYGLLLSVAVFALLVVSFGARGRWLDLPWAVVGLGLPPVLILWGAVTNDNPSIHYAPGTDEAFLVGLALVIGGLVVATVAAIASQRTKHHDLSGIQGR